MFASLEEAESFYSRAEAIIEENEEDWLRYYQASYWASLGDREKALQYLRQAIDLGLIGELVVHDPDLASLRGDPEFEAIVAEVKKRIGEE